jgi:hypothetical protein
MEGGGEGEDRVEREKGTALFTTARELLERHRSYEKRAKQEST